MIPFPRFLSLLLLQGETPTDRVGGPPRRLLGRELCLRSPLLLHTPPRHTRPHKRLWDDRSKRYDGNVTPCRGTASVWRCHPSLVLRALLLLRRAHYSADRRYVDTEYTVRCFLRWVDRSRGTLR